MKWSLWPVERISRLRRSSEQAESWGRKFCRVSFAKNFAAETSGKWSDLFSRVQKFLVTLRVVEIFEKIVIDWCINRKLNSKFFQISEILYILQSFETMAKSKYAIKYITNIFYGMFRDSYEKFTNTFFKVSIEAEILHKNIFRNLNWNSDATHLNCHLSIPNADSCDLWVDLKIRLNFGINIRNA